MVEVAVKDEGIGIPKRTETMFEKFYRADNAVESQTEVQVYACISRESLFGCTVAISVTFEEGVGTTVYFNLPLYGIDLTTKSILVVEDESFLSKVLAERLEDEGFGRIDGPGMEKRP